MQINTKAVDSGKKPCTENVTVTVPEVVEEEQLETVIAADDVIPSVHTSGIHSAANSSCITSEV